jgi:hypothetical protein
LKRQEYWNQEQFSDWMKWFFWLIWNDAERTSLDWWNDENGLSQIPEEQMNFDLQMILEDPVKSDMTRWKDLWAEFTANPFVSSEIKRVVGSSRCQGIVRIIVLICLLWMFPIRIEGNLDSSCPSCSEIKGPIIYPLTIFDEKWVFDETDCVCLKSDPQSLIGGHVGWGSDQFLALWIVEIINLFHDRISRYYVSFWHRLCPSLCCLEI